MKRKIVHIFIQNLKLYVLDSYIGGRIWSKHIGAHNEVIFGIEFLLKAEGLGKD